MTSRNPNNVSGIYIIRFSHSDKVYVGKSRRMHARWISHKSFLRRGKHNNRHLQAAWNKHGEACFRWEIAEIVTGDTVQEVEATLCEAEVRILNLHPNNYNLMQAGEPSMIASDETRAKLSTERKARWADPEYKARVSAAIKAAHQDQEFAAQRAKAISEGHKSAETKAKMAAILKAKWEMGGVLRETHAARTSALWKDPEYKNKQRNSRIAACSDPITQELKAKGLRAAWADPERRARRCAALKYSHARRRAAKAAAEAEHNLTPRDLFGD